ncbi:MAG TPA: DUF1249 domain-containing protein [Gammaproteobacteria bacterium]
MELLSTQPEYYSPAARTFGSLMDIYEQNYIRLRRLIPDFENLGMTAVSTAIGCVDLHYRCLQRSPYTSVFILTYRFEEFEPDLKIRVYHDARVAEVLGGNLQFDKRLRNSKICGLFRADLHNIESKWALNRFLQKWLNFSLRQGHRFMPRSSPWLPETPIDLAAQAAADF